MNSKRPLSLIILCLFCAARLSQAWDTPRNPDLRPSFGFQAGGGLDVNASQSINGTKPAQNVTRGVGNQTSNFFTDALFPISDHWSLQAGAGIISDHSTSDATALLAGSSTDRTSANAVVTSRYFFIDHSLVSTPLTQNPDQCPSLAFIVSGQDSIYREGTDDLNGNKTPHQGGLNQNLSFGGDTRLPVSDAVTLLANMTGTFTAASTPQTASTAGSETRSQTLTYGGGLKYYFVGSNGITHDTHKNPDRWTSTSFTVDGISKISGHQITTSATTGTDDRGITTTGFSLASELRIPVTNNLSLRFQASGGETNQQVGLSVKNTGSKTTTPSFSGFAGIRGYFL